MQLRNSRNLWFPSAPEQMEQLWCVYHRGPPTVVAGPDEVILVSVCRKDKQHLPLGVTVTAKVVEKHGVFYGRLEQVGSLSSQCCLWCWHIWKLFSEQLSARIHVFVGEQSTIRQLPSIGATQLQIWNPIDCWAGWAVTYLHNIQNISVRILSLQTMQYCYSSLPELFFCFMLRLIRFKIVFFLRPVGVVHVPIQRPLPNCLDVNLLIVGMFSPSLWQPACYIQPTWIECFLGVQGSLGIIIFILISLPPS